MQHFFIPNTAIQDGTVTLPEDISRQLRQVLRVDEKGEAIVVLDNSGWEYLVQLEGRKGKKLVGSVVGKQLGRPEPGIRLRLSFSLTRREKIEWIIQKGTELGVTAFQPFTSSRSLVKDLHENSARQQRLNSIIREAAEQSMRSGLPVLMPAVKFADLLARKCDGCRRLIAWEETAVVERLTPEMLALESGALPAEIELVIGPEGGFSSEEISLAEKNGYEQVSLGPYILRTETACITGASILRHLSDRVLSEE